MMQSTIVDKTFSQNLVIKKNTIIYFLDLVNVVKFTDSYNVIPFVRAYLRNQKSPTHALWVLPEVPIGQRMFLVFLDIFQQRGCDSDALWLTRLNLSYKSTVDFKYCNKVTSGSFTKSIGPSLRSILTVHSAPCNKSCKFFLLH